MFRSLRAKIMLGFVVIVLLVTFVAVWTVVHTSRISDRMQVIEESDFSHVRAVNQMRSAVSRYDVAILRYISEPTDSIRAVIAAHHEDFHLWLDNARASYREEEDLRRIDTVASEFRRLNVRFTELVELLAAGEEGGDNRVEQGMLFYTVEILPLHDHLTNILRVQRERDHARIIANIRAVHSTALFISYSTAVIALVVLILSLMLSQKVLRIVLDPIRQLTLSARRIAEGDFSRIVPESGDGDEMSELVRHFNVMVRRLRQYDNVKIGQIMAEKRRCETMIRDLSDVVIATDQESRIIYFNRQAEDVTGIPARRAIGHRLAEVASDHPLMQRIQEDTAPTERGANHQQDAIIVLPLRGSEHTYRYELQPIRGDEEDPLGHVFRLTDVTRYKQLDAIKSRMVSTVSHELRTPLTSMGMSLELLMEGNANGGLDPMQAELLGTMKEDVARLQRFAHDLLDISQVESGELALALAPASPRGLVDSAVQSVRVMTEPQEIQIDTTGVPLDLPDVLVDSNRINQVLGNLYGNAIRYTPFRGTITVAAERQEEFIQFCVQDNGPGIPEEEAPHIFEKFYQGRDSQRAGGSGLGLTIVREIIEAHGGSVRVKSAIGKGSSFYFTLRIAR